MTVKTTKTKAKTTTATTTSNKSNRPLLGKCSTEVWFDAPNARTKFVDVTLERTADGYRVVEAHIQNQINQYAMDYVRADARALTRDIKRRGIFSK
jgi:hypothetical protein